MEIIGIINEDGTSIDDFPKNPLKEKWDKLYPPTPKVEYSQVCDGYSCMWCDRCPNGSHWQVPDEDKEVYEEYQKQIQEYHRIHNPSLNAYNMLNKLKKEYGDKLWENYYYKLVKITEE